MPLPSFGRDTAVVSGYLAAGYEAYLRLFMPLDSAEGPVRWSALLAGGEAALRGDLRFFDDIDPAVRERRGLEYYTPLKVWMKQPPSASAADSSSRAGRATPDGAPGWPASCPSTPPPRTTCATPFGPATRESSTRWRDG